MPSRAGTSPQTPSRGFKLPAPWLWLLVFAVVLIAYGPALSAGFIWDDDGHITRADLRSLAGLGRIWFEFGATQQYYPLLHSAFWLEHHLWGDSPFGYHLLNVLLHATNACLFATLLRRLAVPGAWFAALLFALHPIAVESVAWISEQKNTLSTALCLGAALAYLRFATDRRPRAYALATLLFFLALATKTVTATLPAALLVIFWWQRGRLEFRRDTLPLLPWFALGAAAGLLTAHFERALIGANGADFNFSLLDRILIAGHVVWFYLGKLLWPADLLFIYPRWAIDSSRFTLWLFPLAALVLLATLGIRATRIGRHRSPASAPSAVSFDEPVTRRSRAPLAALLLFGGMLFPVLGFFNVYPFLFSFVADHFAYLASLAFFAFVAGGLSLSSARLSLPARLGAAGIVLFVLATLTWSQASLYRDVFTLYEQTLARNPSAWMAHNNLAMALTESGRVAEAIPHLEAALKLHPDYAIAESNLGDDLTRVGRAQDAVPHLERALQLQPDYAEAHNNLGVTLVALDRTTEAIAHYEQALRLKPGYANAHRNLGLALAISGRTADAIPHFERAVELDPQSADAELGWGIALMLTDRFPEAVPHFERACALDTASPKSHLTYGRALAEHHQPDAAIAQFRAALEIDSRSAEAHLGLALALRSQGQTEEAAQHFQAARQLGIP